MQAVDVQLVNKLLQTSGRQNHQCLLYGYLFFLVGVNGEATI